MRVAAPVPTAKDTGKKYGDKPVSSGPYRFETIDPGKEAVLVRNEEWDRATDTVRRALPDRIELIIGTAPDEIDRQLLDGDLDARRRRRPGCSRQPAEDPARRRAEEARTDEPTTGFVQYSPISTAVAPVRRRALPRAVQYAADKTAVQTARGGPDAGGDITGACCRRTSPATTPQLDPFQTRSGKPQVDKAKEELAACGRPDGFETVIAARDSPQGAKTAEAMQAALAAVASTPASTRQTRRSTPGRSSAPVERARQGLRADHGRLVGGLPDRLRLLPDAHRRPAHPAQRQQQLLRAVRHGDQRPARPGQCHPDPIAAGKLWSQVDAAVMDSATMLPLTYDKVLNYRNPRLTNVFVNQYYGMWDITALGVA